MTINLLKIVLSIIACKHYWWNIDFSRNRLSFEVWTFSLTSIGTYLGSPSLFWVILMSMQTVGMIDTMDSCCQTGICRISQWKSCNCCSFFKFPFTCSLYQIIRPSNSSFVPQNDMKGINLSSLQVFSIK